jgi:hypothetical protein
MYNVHHENYPLALSMLPEGGGGGGGGGGEEYWSKFSQYLHFQR